MYIYKTTNLINGKFYIGKCSKSVNSSTKYFGSGNLLCKAINKYGIENFIKEILFETDNIDELNEKEKEYIDLLDACNRNIAYNIAKGGEGGDTISNHPERNQIIENYSERNKQYWTKEKCDERSKKYMSDGNPFANKNHSEFSKKKISEKKKGISMSENTKSKISSTLKNKYASGELVKVVSDECRNKISNSHLGMHHTPETCNKISNSIKGENNPFAQNWIFSNKNGIEIKIKGGFKKFCEDYSLSYSIMRKIAYGIRKEKFYNDWTVRIDNEKCKI